MRFLHREWRRKIAESKNKICHCQCQWDYCKLLLLFHNLTIKQLRYAIAVRTKAKVEREQEMSKRSICQSKLLQDTNSFNQL